jgi:RHS repeat-associated protein
MTHTEMILPVDTNGNTRYSAPNLPSGLPVYSACNSTSTVTSSNGSPANYTFTCSNLSISNVVNGTAYVGTEPFLTAVTLPDGSSYDFSYDTGNTGNHYGTLLSVTLPTGGTVSFTYILTGTGWPSPMKAQTVTYGGGTWNLSYVQSNCSATCTSTTTVLAPPRYDSVSQTNVSDKAVFASTVFTTGPFLLKTAQYYSGSSTLSRTVTFTPDNLLPATVTTTLNDTGQSSSVFYQYFASMRDYPTQKQETDFSGTIVRTTKTAYGNFARPLSVNVYAGSGTGSPIASTLYTYDEYSASYCKNSVPMLAPISGAYGHDDANFGASNTSRGNVTTIRRLISGTTYSTTHMCYDTLGNVTQTVDANGNPTSYDYSENWTDSYCIPSGTVTHSFPTTITDALGHRTKKSFYSCTVLPQSIKDENDIQASRNGTTFAYELLNRPLAINYPDGGQTTYCYSHDPTSSCYTTALPPFVTSSKVISGATTLNTKTLLDSYGRTVETQLTSDPDCTNATKTDTSYDSFGRPLTVSNPYCSTADLTYGSTSYQYDLLGRVTKVIPPDGSSTSNNVTTTYSGPCSTVTDQAGNARKSCSDALGRLTQVIEDPAGLKYETDYSYDVLDNLLSVNQLGGSANSANWRTRTFNYDSLSRLISATNPESGASTYSYDAAGNLLNKTSPAPNQTSTATVTLSYCYDALNRLTAKAYTQQTCSNGTLPSPVVTYLYDKTSYNGLTIANGIGRRTGMTDSAGAEAWSYDTMGRIAADQRTTNSLTRSYSYAYNLDGSLYTATHPDGLVVTFQQGGAGRPLSEISGDAGYVYNVHYAPNGSVCFRQQNWGQESTVDNTFNNRFQPVRVYMQFDYNFTPPAPCSTPSQISNTQLDFTYSFIDDGHNNGNVASIVMNTDSTRSQKFSYDSLNRISTAQTLLTYSGWNGPARCWGEQFGYDPWGNLLSISGVSTAYNGCTQENLSVSVNGKNQIIGNTYDAAGNLFIAQPGNVQYNYDAENHLISTSGQTYLYDGDGKRVEKATTGTPPVPNKLYWYGAEDSPILETDALGNELYRYFRFLGTLVAREEANDWVDHYGVDALGNVRFLYGYNGEMDMSDYYPFGGERVVLSQNNNNTRKFTAKERDSESGLDNFGARYNSSSMGRFMSPDPLLNSGRPWAPQSWNRYAYAQNNPLNIVDPTGLYDLNNTCKQDDKKCNKQFRQHADDLKNGLKNLQDKLKNVKDSVQKARLEKALAAMGTEGDHNGVTVNFGKTLGGGAGETTPVNDPQTYKETYNVTLDPSKLNGQDDYAMAGAHEGTHVDDISSELANPALGVLSDFSLEFRGYQTSAYAWSALGYPSLSMNYDGKSYPIWNSSWGAVDKNITNFVTKFHDKNGQPDHPETTPHNPWPN